VFGIAISGAFKEIQGSLAELPTTAGADEGGDAQPETGTAEGGSTVDELAARRARRRAG
jgi:hypothetical protein